MVYASINAGRKAGLAALALAVGLGLAGCSDRGGLTITDKHVEPYRTAGQQYYRDRYHVYHNNNPYDLVVVLDNFRDRCEFSPNGFVLAGPHWYQVIQKALGNPAAVVRDIKHKNAGIVAKIIESGDRHKGEYSHVGDVSPDCSFSIAGRKIWDEGGAISTEPTGSKGGTLDGGSPNIKDGLPSGGGSTGG